MTFYITATNKFTVFYDYTVDKLAIYWRSSTASRRMYTEQFDTGASYDNINSEIVLFGAIRFDQQTGQRFFAIVNGVKQTEDMDWDGAPDAFAAISTLFIGHESSTEYAHSLIRSVEIWNWNGVDPGVLNDESDIDSYLAKNNEKLFSFQNIQILNSGFRKAPPVITLTASAAVTSLQVYVDEIKEGIQIDDSIFGTPGYTEMIIDCEQGTLKIGDLDRSSSILPGTGFFNIPVGLSTLKIIATGGTVIADIDMKTRRYI
jgi:hypothetical protein